MTVLHPSVSNRFPVLPVLAALLGFVGSLGTAVLAAPDATRVAVVVVPGSPAAWAAIDRSGLPVVQVRLGELLVVVDGAAAPKGMAVLRAAQVLLLDAAMVPGCDTERDKRPEGNDNEPDA